MGALFRGKFMTGLQALLEKGELHDDLPDRAARGRRQRIFKTSWVVYANRPSGRPEQVYLYLSRYTHRVAIGNARLVTVDKVTVVFRTRGNETAALSPIEFIGRFLQHILPHHFVKIRHFGLLGAGNVHSKLKQAAILLPAADTMNAPPDHHEDEDELPAIRPEDPNPTWQVLLFGLTGQDVLLCPNCQQRTIVRHPLPPSRGPPWKRGAI